MHNKRVSKIIFKVVSIFLIIFFVFNISMIQSFCSDSIGSGAVKEFQKKANNQEIKTSTQNIIGPILNIVQIVSSGIALLMLILLAMKYIVSSVEEKSEIKKHAVIYVVGATIMFGATGIIGIIKQFAKNIDYK